MQPIVGKTLGNVIENISCLILINLNNNVLANQQFNFLPSTTDEL